MPTTDPQKGEKAGPNTDDEPNLAPWRAKVLLDVDTLREMVAEVHPTKPAADRKGPPPGGRPS
jgi:hypothetical protein